jgi:ApbE superfamily uncharacterized protein (UPF0280 family)
MDCAKVQSGITAHWLIAERRLHLQHGPIDLVIEVEGEPSECERAFKQAVDSFNDVLNTLVAELALLRTPISAYLKHNDAVKGVIAKQMVNAVLPHSANYVTPMAAVAGAVADHVLAAMINQRQLHRAFVNNGGDIALYISDQASYKVGLVSNLQTAQQQATVTIQHAKPIRGLATSGWQGRSHSQGIADAVTVLAENAAKADVAATLIANAVNLPGSHKVTRESAESLTPDSDLGQLLVTTNVMRLSHAEKHTAAKAGLRVATQMINRGLIAGVCINVQGLQQTLGYEALTELREIA